MTDTPRSSKTIRISQINYLASSTTTIPSEPLSGNAEESYKTIESESEQSSDDSVEFTIDWGSRLYQLQIDVPGELVIFLCRLKYEYDIEPWGLRGIEENAWDDKVEPVVKFKKYNDLELNDLELRGVLSDRIIAASSSYLDRSPETGNFVLCKADLSSKSLVDIMILTFHHHLQYVDLSWNQLEDVECLGELPFLMYLDVSHNKITRLLNFKSPINLTYVNYSFNNIAELTDLSTFWSIVFLDVSHNYIHNIEGLQNLMYLKHLNLSYNLISRVENLNFMKLLTLNLENNYLSSFEEGENVGFKTLQRILKINLDFNQLNSLRLFEEVYTIQSVSVQENNIVDLIELGHLRKLNFLSEVYLRGNPITESCEYFEVCVNNVPHITILDGDILDADKKTAVKNSFNPSMHSAAFTSASTSLFVQHLNDPILGLPVVPFNEQPSPIIILVGPPASNKKITISTLSDLFPIYVVQGISHTTRKMVDDETDKFTYYFTSNEKFWKLAREGEFLNVSQILGHNYGLAQSELGKTVGRKCALILHMDLKGALTMRAKNINVCLVLAMPTTPAIHTKFIFEKYYSQPILELTTDCATKVMNFPSKALESLAESERLRKLADEQIAVKIVKDIIEMSMLKRSFPCQEGEEEEEVNEAKEEEENETKEGCTCNVTSIEDTIEKPASRTRSSGILKKVSIKSDDTTTSQTCQNEDTKPTRSSRYSTSHSQTYHGVTFDDTIKKFVKSVSNIALDENVTHSILSQSLNTEKRITASDTAEKRMSAMWNIQTDAIREVTTEILNWRESYLQFHNDNPGVFLEVIFTDEIHSSVLKLAELLKTIMSHGNVTLSTFKYHHDPAYKEMIGTRLSTLHNDIKSEMSISTKQLKQYQYTTSKGKPFESNLRKTKKDIIKTVTTSRKEALSYKLPNDDQTNRRLSSIKSVDDSIF
ncbi:hypothetical protein FQA39_LY03259 [Lamprigera yunnana]|nr:hypothetical protein FQA39_LY03259 [Lamprigera yunnana]